MGFFTRRYFFLSICLLQVVSMVERQVFDFLGFLWIPILVNFFEIIFIIFGFFGAYQYRPKYIIAYLLWHLFWIGWNIFLICLYLNVAGLDHESNEVLKLDHNSDSWWKKEGPGCKVRDVDVHPMEYDGCLINYVQVEIVQAALQCFISFFNCIVGICICRMFVSDEEDTFNYETSDGPDNILLHPVYVNSSDTLHSSFKFSSDTLHSSDKLMDVTPNKYVSFNDRRQNSRPVYADTIRNPLRSNSFNSITVTGKNRAARPKSLCLEATLDM